MAMINHAEVARRKAEREAFEKLENYLTGNGSPLEDLAEKHFALAFIKDEFMRSEEKSKEIKQFKGFFNTLYSFLPNRYVPPTVYK